MMTATETQDPLDTLEHENSVAEKLIEHLAKSAIELRAGRDPPPGEIAEGLRLLEQYRQVHAERVDNDLKIEAQPVAMSTCFQHLGTIADDHRAERGRIELARNVLEEYAGDPEGARTRLSEALADLTEEDHQSLVFENDYPLSCLRAALPDDAAARVTAAFRRTDPKIGDLEGHIERYLGHATGTPGHALNIRCSHANCDATARSHVVPSNDGRLGIEVPPGWQVVSRPPVFGKDGTVRLKVDFCCPSHGEESTAREKKTLDTWADDGGSAPPRAETEGPESGDCCGPIPQDAR
jgi:hypothetical protein